MKKRLVVFLTLICIVALLLPLTVSAAEAGTVSGGLGYYEDGTQVTDDVILYGGKYYAFDYWGDMYVDETFWLDGYYRRAKEDGTLYANVWYYHEDWDAWYYYGEEGKAAQDFVKINGVWYYFNYEGRMLTDQVVWSNVDQAWFILGPDPDGGQYTKVVQGWQNVYDQWYYGEVVDGVVCPVDYDTRKIGGKWYGFDGSGKMIAGEDQWVDGGVCRAREDGTLYVNEWYQSENGSWYYYGAEGIAPDDFYKIGNVWYFFDGWGEMRQDCVVWSYDYQSYYVLNQDGTKHQALSKLGWNAAFGNWYYLRQTGDSISYVYGEVLEDGGKQYYFQWDGKMMADHASWISELGQYMYADANGVLTDTAWIKEDGDWRYLQNGHFLEGGIYQLGGKLYCFDWNGYLRTEPGEYNEYYYIAAGGSGQLYQNQWRYREITYPYQIGWVYYGNDGAMLRNEAQRIGGSLYGFDSDGVMITNDVEDFDGVTYSFNAAGVGTVLANGWHKHPVTQEWMYVNDGWLADGILEISGVAYAFNGGYMVSESAWWGEYNGTEGYYLFGADGAMVTKPGWVQMAGEWVYVQNNGSLKEGWLDDGGNWYYMEPAMAHDRVIYAEDEAICYVANSKGVCTAVQGNGLQVVAYNDYWYGTYTYRVYLVNGRAVTNTWKQVDGFWYYFNSEGLAYRGDSYEINGELYLFDGYGKLQTGGWVSLWGSWYYANPANDNALRTGLQTLGGNQYLFDEYSGQMYCGGCYYYDGKYYLTATNGVVLLSTAKEGWNQVGEDWYYVRDGYLVRNQVIEVNGAYYGFDKQGKMLSGGYAYCGWDYYMFGADGRVRTGWQKVNGQWVYCHPDWLYAVSGDCYINGKLYVFDYDGYLMTGSFVRWGTRYTTDSDGAVVKQEEIPDGWYYGDGNWYYTVNGEGYDGWLGDYYLENGYMRYNEFVEYDGKIYYLTPNGLCLRNGWYETRYEGWIYAKADGSLVCSQWMQSGSTWYYFYGYYMVQDTVEWIDGEYHVFDENGKWLGVETDEENYPTGYADGWQKISGKWYYFYNGMPSFGDMYIDGNRYYFDLQTGIMVTNTMEGDSGWYYFGSDGAAVKYTGWQKINGTWYYFNPDHTLYFGLIRDSKGLCNLRVMYNVDTEQYECVMAKSEHLRIGTDLYYFDANGYSTGAISRNGWYEADEDYYYFENGALIGSGYREIGGVGYYFYEGRMVADQLEYCNGSFKYFTASGAMATKAGWYKVQGESWVYVRDASGRIYEDGIYIIGGTQYTFSGGILIG